MPFKDFLNASIIFFLALSSKASSDVIEDFSSKTSDATVTNEVLNPEYSNVQPEYSKPEFSKLEPQYSDTAYSSSGPAAAFLPFDDKEVISSHPDAITLFAVLLLALLLAPATIPGQTWSPFSNLAWRLSSTLTGRSFGLLSRDLRHQNRVPVSIVEDPSSLANVDPRNIFHNWQKNL